MSEKSNPLVLPYGARGIEAGPLAIEFTRDKVIFIFKSANEHFTLHEGKRSGVLDVHRTWTNEDGVVSHETLFAIRHSDIPSLLSELSLQLSGLCTLVRRLRLGWLARHGISIVHGLEFTTNEDIARIAVRNRRKRLEFKEDEILRNIDIPKYLEDILDFPDGPFSLFKGRRRVGIAFKVTDVSGRLRLFWVKTRDLTQFGNRMGPYLISAALRYSISREKYCEHV